MNVSTHCPIDWEEPECPAMWEMNHLLLRSCHSPSVWPKLNSCEVRMGVRSPPQLDLVPQCFQMICFSTRRNFGIFWFTKAIYIITLNFKVQSTVPVKYRKTNNTVVLFPFPTDWKYKISLPGHWPHTFPALAAPVLFCSCLFQITNKI